MKKILSYFTIAICILGNSFVMNANDKGTYPIPIKNGNHSLSDKDGSIVYVSKIKPFEIEVFDNETLHLIKTIDIPYQYEEEQSIYIAFPKDKTNNIVYSKLLVIVNYRVKVGEWEHRTKADLLICDTNTGEFKKITNEPIDTGANFGPTVTIARGRVYLPTFYMYGSEGDIIIFDYNRFLN